METNTFTKLDHLPLINLLDVLCLEKSLNFGQHDIKNFCGKMIRQNLLENTRARGTGGGDLDAKEFFEQKMGRDG